MPNHATNDTQALQDGRNPDWVRLEGKIDTILRILNYHFGTPKDVLDPDAWTPEAFQRELNEYFKERE